MSRARAEKDRVALDAYQTPDELALAIVTEQRRRHGDVLEVIEPSAGTGAFVRACRLVFDLAHITAVELDPARRGALTAAGAHLVQIDNWKLWATRLANEQCEEETDRLIIGNPPFRLAQEHIEAGLDLLREGERMALLLRLNFLGAGKRVAFWRRRQGLETVQTITPRPSFGLNKHGKPGSDGTEYAVFSWRKGYGGAARILPPLVWAPPRARRAA